MTDKVVEKAILLLGHGSKAPEANETLRKVAASVKSSGGYGAVLPAFLQMAKPDFQQGVDELVSVDRAGGVNVRPPHAGRHSRRTGTVV